MNALLSDKEFNLIRGFVREKSGISLSDSKRSLVASRLNKRLRHLGIKSFLEYYERVLSNEAEAVHMLDLITTNKTEFFRDAEQFELLRRQFFPAMLRREAVRRQEPIRVWSAACSSGEEAYSIAMCFVEAFEEHHEVPLEIIATDISARMLERAKAGIYELSRLTMFPAERLKKFFLKGTGENAGLAQVKSFLRERVKFQRLNLHAPLYPFVAPFDVVFCRNVLIYFAPAQQRELIDRIHEWIRPGGMLFTGHSESLHTMSRRFKFVRPSVYVRTCENKEEPAGVMMPLPAHS